MPQSFPLKSKQTKHHQALKKINNMRSDAKTKKQITMYLEGGVYGLHAEDGKTRNYSHETETGYYSEEEQLESKKIL